MEQSDFTVSQPCQYVQDRDKLIAEILNLVHIVYPGDKNALSSIIDGTVNLQVAEPNQKFVDGMRGYMLWASMANQSPSAVLSTLIHDLCEFANERHTEWFSPRTSMYEKYLTGASGVTA